MRTGRPGGYPVLLGSTASWWPRRRGSRCSAGGQVPIPGSIAHSRGTEAHNTFIDLPAGAGGVPVSLALISLILLAMWLAIRNRVPVLRPLHCWRWQFSGVQRPAAASLLVPTLRDCIGQEDYRRRAGRPGQCRRSSAVASV